MSWKIFVALRYLAAKRKEKFISIISVISVLGIALGVGVLIIVISVMSGFDESLQEKMVGTYAHIEIISDYGMEPSQDIADKISDTKHVKAISFFLNGQVLLKSGDGYVGAIVKGIDPEKEVKVSKLGEYMQDGTVDMKDGELVIGSELAAKLNLKVGTTISVVSPALTKARYNDGKKFRIAGIFSSGMFDYDMNVIYSTIPSVQEMLGAKDVVSGASVNVDDLFNVDGVKKELQLKMGPAYAVRTWIDSNKNFLEALKLEKTVVFLIVTLTIIVACFNITGTLIMTVLEKTKDIGILKAIGATNFDIMVIFAICGEIIGIIGTLLGAVGGISLCWCLKTYDLIKLPNFYYLDKLPIKFEVNDIITIILSSLVLSLLATIYPAYKASRLDPVEALRYE